MSDPQQAPGCDTCSRRDHAECPSPGAQSCSSWERQYYDADDKRRTLSELCRMEPAWAANVIRTLSATNDRAYAALAKAEAERDSLSQHYAPYVTALLNIGSSLGLGESMQPDDVLRRFYSFESESAALRGETVRWEGRVGDYLTEMGACDDADPDEEESLCRNETCTYCSMARMFDPTPPTEE